MNDGMGTGRSTKLRDRLPRRGGDGGDPVAQVMGPSARRLRATGSALYRDTRFPSLVVPTGGVRCNRRRRTDRPSSVRQRLSGPLIAWLRRRNFIIIFHFLSDENTK